MSREDFIAKVKAEKIPDNTKLEVYTQDNKCLGKIEVTGANIKYLDLETLPNDLLVGDYIFKEIENNRK